MAAAADLMRSGAVVMARVISTTSGGGLVVVAEGDIRGFLPEAQLSMKLLDGIDFKAIKTPKQKREAMAGGMKALVGTSFEVIMYDFDTDNRIVTFSQKAAQRLRRREALELEDELEDLL